ncbi:hypothetical protein L798_05621 [Zootermopsis nevadensis]|uniref:Uncharacterized protein n=1 Tax=Zootermopsis nevadensis TaxID=136037 RepID=A0A067RKU1_ZOONE|nr:hypothetical protein L798_05621 [Zootermopsis nevadensis]
MVSCKEQTKPDASRGLQSTEMSQLLWWLGPSWLTNPVLPKSKTSTMENKDADEDNTDSSKMYAQFDTFRSHSDMFILPNTAKSHGVVPSIHLQLRISMPRKGS